MLRRVFAILLAMVVALVLIGFVLPASVTVERNRVIEHSPDVIFEVLSDFRHFIQWSPWLDGAPEDSYRLEGPPSGEGATLVWRETGEGTASRMWITGTAPPQRIDLQLELGDNEADGYFMIEPQGGAQRVTWGLQMQFGMLDLAGRYVGLMLPGLIRRDYDEGLERLEAYLDAHSGRVPERSESREDELLSPGG